ncbi:MAG: sorbosone dehydrogenase family protein [Alphaproteobacteria bacterium]|nr:sorbosone dehydrogenase family protein [Alphaproteobacteria bacterium]
MTLAKFTLALLAAAVFGSSAWAQADRPGTAHRISADLPPPYATPPAANPPRIVARPADAVLAAPPGFSVSEFLGGLTRPRLLTTAPNGDIFVAESAADRVTVVRAPAGAPQAGQHEIFAADLNRPFGIAFYPPGPDPRWVYVANEESVVRFPYRNGDLRASGPPETVIRNLPAGGHWTRSLAFTPDGKHLLVSVGSASNDAEAGMALEADRADILEFDPDGGHKTIYASGLRNAVDIRFDGDALLAVVNERDGLGDDLPPDYLTRVQPGGFYGWPWYYIGAHADPHHRGEHPELAHAVLAPDLLIQPHSAPLGLVVYEGAQFPPDYRGDVFVALHGSWNRSVRTGYKIVRVRMKDGAPTGEYDDFVTGFLLPNGTVWGRPVGVTVARDGALIFSDDGSGTLWRVAYIK